MEHDDLDLPDGTSQGRVEILPREECLRLLSNQAIGRLVVTIDYLPTAFPVNICVKDGSVFFTSTPGTKLEKAIKRSVMSIEVDHWDTMRHEGWSVLVTGRSELVNDHALSESVRRQLEAWAPGIHQNVVRIPATFVSGRRVTRDMRTKGGGPECGGPECSGPECGGSR